MRDPRNPGRRRLPRATAEAGLILVALLLMLAAATAGYLVGRETGDGGGAAAETTAETDTGGDETTETETAPGTTEAGTTETETETGDDGGDDVDGSAVFAEAGCGSCHTFGPANASGTIGPNLEETDLNKDEIAEVVRNGRNAMPAFGGRLSDAEIEAVADFVESG